MKRAIHILFWVAMALGIAVVALRNRGEKTVAPAAPAPLTAPKLVLPPPSPDTLAALPAPSSDTATVAARQAVPESEADFLKKIKDNVRANPELAVALARQARQQFGDSAPSDERDKLLVDALVNQQKIGAARDETGYYYKHHPAGQYRQYLWSLTGARPEPPVGPAAR
jgi:hypothetical protein